MFKYLLKLSFVVIWAGMLNASSGVSQDVETSNAGEKAMIASLRTAVNKEIFAHDRIVIGTGVSGCKAFKTPAKGNKIHVFLTWQWLDDMAHLAKDTVVVMPKHAVDNHLNAIKNRINLVTIEGVLHTKTQENVMQEKLDAITSDPRFIVMLAGDTQQTDGTWRMYTPEMAEAFAKELPEGSLLILNGPRTGRHHLVEGALVEDKTAHRTTTDLVTQRVKDLSKSDWKIEDFTYGAPSLWGPALRYCLENSDVTLVLPGESTSMICEALGLGIRPAIYRHDLMTETSTRYVTQLVEEGKATLYPNLPEKDETRQEAVEPQEIVVVQYLQRLIAGK